MARGWSRIPTRIRRSRSWRCRGALPNTCSTRPAREICRRLGENDANNPITRRDVLKTLALGAAGSSVLQIVPLQAAQHVHQMIAQERAHSPARTYRAKFFSAHQYQTLSSLCDAIIPADEHSGGAVKAGAPEFIDLLTSENKDYQLSLGGGVMWLDGFRADRYGTTYLACSPAPKKEVLALIAYRKI